MAIKAKRSVNENFFPQFNSKGQAALTDSLYFLLIVSGLSTMMFFYAANYGLNVQERVTNQYFREYTTSALETIVYSSTPRIAGNTLDDATEIDYLLAAVKEDFADDKKLVETKASLAQNIEGIMQPIAASYDYLFYIYRPDTKEFVFTMIYTRSGKEEAQVLFCEPETMAQLLNLTDSVGTSSSSPPIRMQLVELDEKNDATYAVAETSLKTWTPTPIDDLISGMGCEVHKTITQKPD